MNRLMRNFARITVIGALCICAYFLITSPFTTASDNERESRGDPFAHSIQQLAQWSVEPANSFQPPACYYRLGHLCQPLFFLLPFAVFIPVLIFLLQEFLPKYPRSVAAIMLVTGGIFLVSGIVLFGEISTNILMFGVGHSDGMYAQKPTVTSAALLLWFAVGVGLVIRQSLVLRALRAKTINR